MSEADHNKIEERLEEELGNGFGYVCVMVDSEEEAEKAKQIIEEEGGVGVSSHPVDGGRSYSINYNSS